VDLFLCGDDACNTVADLMFVASASDPDRTPFLGFGYQRIPHGLLAIPTRYIDPASARSVLSKDGFGNGSRSVKLNAVAWMIDDPRPMGNSPSITRFGTLARSLAVDGNINWDRIRVGNYLDSRGVCVTLFTPVNSWFDEQGWGTAEDCESSETYLFTSFFPQVRVLSLLLLLRASAWDSRAQLTVAIRCLRVFMYRRVIWISTPFSMRTIWTETSPPPSLSRGKAMP
jgi:hypothetical protein